MEWVGSKGAFGLFGYRTAFTNSAIEENQEVTKTDETCLCCKFCFKIC